MRAVFSPSHFLRKVCSYIILSLFLEVAIYLLFDKTLLHGLGSSLATLAAELGNLSALFLVFGLLNKTNWRALNQKSFSWKAAFSGVFLVLTAKVVGTFVSYYLLGAIQTGGAVDQQSKSILSNSEIFLSVLPAFATTAIIAPIAEEIFFRGIIYSGLKKHYGIIPALLVSSLFFGLAHGEPVLIMISFFLGLALGWIYEKSGNIWVSIFAHLSVNSLALLAIFFNLPKA